MNNEFVFVLKTTKTPSLKAVVFTPLIYLFGSFAFVSAYAFSVSVYSVAFGISLEEHASFYTAIVYFLYFLFALIMTIFIVKRYGGYLFSSSWKINFYRHLKTGLKWSIPFIFLTGIEVLIPETHVELTRNYLIENNLSPENFTLITVILISAAALIATFLEELIFRGMIQQYIKKYVTPRISVLITAAIFTLGHFGEFFFDPVCLIKIGGWFILGIFTGFAFNKANSCISAFIPHLMFNIRYIIIVPLMLIF